MPIPTPFKVDIPQAQINEIKSRVANYPWHEMPDDGGWDYGTNLDYMREFCDYWANHFDWYTQQDVINRFNHFKVDIDGIDLHFIHEKGSGSNPRPLIISHGWPGSVVEFLDIIDRLAHPERFGGDERDAFDVIAPSLPGFAFSSRPPRPWGPRRMASVLNTLMTDVLGYEKYIAQGGDWGGAISSFLGFDYPEHCVAIHINILTMRHPDGVQTREEREWERQFEIDQFIEDGYRAQQSTKPQTLSYAMNDSPVGVAAWILEKMTSWSDTDGNNVESAYTKDELLTNIMVYIVTRCFNSASWIYYGRREEGGRVLSPEGLRVEVPVGCAILPKEFLAWPPRSYVERIYNVQHWSEFPRGGHFAAMEEPELLANDIRQFAKLIRL